MRSGVDFRHARGPDGLRLYAIGDVHGRLDLLTEMHERILGEIERDRVPDYRIIHLGDYVDRGPDSCGVLAFLTEASGRNSCTIALAGNHDAGMLAFLDDPDPDSLFARSGGTDTAYSYGVELDPTDLHRMNEQTRRLREAIPPAHLSFLRSLELSTTFGDFFFCHAGIRPGVPLDRQAADDLLWIRTAFHAYQGLHPKVVVHGHTPVAKAEMLPNRVNLDTGAFHTGLLSALAVEGGEKWLVEVKR